LEIFDVQERKYYAAETQIQQERIIGQNAILAWWKVHARIIYIVHASYSSNAEMVQLENVLNHACTLPGS